MTQISVSELKVNPGKYVGMAQEQDVFITKNGKVVAKIVTAKPDKKAAWENIKGIFRGTDMNLTDEELEKLRGERILGQ